MTLGDDARVARCEHDGVARRGLQEVVSVLKQSHGWCGYKRRSIPEGPEAEIA